MGVQIGRVIPSENWNNGSKMYKPVYTGFHKPASFLMLHNIRVGLLHLICKITVNQNIKYDYSLLQTFYCLLIIF